MLNREKVNEGFVSLEPLHVISLKHLVRKQAHRPCPEWRIRAMACLPVQKSRAAESLKS